jgi:V8-like Glu-specific endopeptidase
MADTDVVEHKFNNDEMDEVIDWEESLEPVPILSGEEGQPVTPLTVIKPKPDEVTKDERNEEPYRSIGKLGMTYEVGVNQYRMRYSSGWVVATRAFITAGHCVYKHNLSGKEWPRNGRFEPRFHLKESKYYKVIAIYTLAGWVNSKKPAYDMAACVIGEDFANTEPPLQFDTKSLKRTKSYTAVGYPGKPIGEFDYSGERMWKCVGKGQDAGALKLAENNFTSGASGGPWFDNDTNYVVTGINSFRRDNQNVLYSPYFKNGFQKLFDIVSKK